MDIVKDEVIAHGEGTAWTLQGAKLEAYDNLMADRAAIEASLPAHLEVDWGQIRGYEMNFLTYYGWHYSQMGTVSDPNGNVCYQEFQDLMDAIAEVETQLQEELEIDGWWGNMTGGAKCNEVHDFIEAKLNSIKTTLGQGLTCYDVATMFDSGSLPFDIAAHVYLAVIDRQTGEILYVLDPWRYAGDCTLIPYEDDPNGGDPEMVIPWGRPARTDDPTQRCPLPAQRPQRHSHGPRGSSAT